MEFYITKEELDMALTHIQNISTSLSVFLYILLLAISFFIAFKLYRLLVKPFLRGLYRNFRI